MNVTMRLEGGELVIRKFEKLKKLNLKRAREGTKEAVNNVLEGMRRLVPRRTGLMASSIAIVAAPVGPDWFMVYAGVKAVFYPRPGKRRMDTATVARWVERGTRFMKARPFMMPPFNTLRTSLRTTVERELLIAINEAVGGQGA